MDEHRTDLDDRPEPATPPVEAPAAPRPAPPPEVFAMPPATGKEAWRGGSGCGPRVRIYLFGIAAVILVAMLLAGLSVLRRGVWVNLDQARRAVAQSLPHELPAAERQRTVRNLDRFRRLLEAVDDPYPIMGEFMTRVRAVLKDGRLTVDEVSGLNVYIERAIEEAGVAPMQLGIRNSEFGIRNAALPPLSTARTADREHASAFSIHSPAPDSGPRCTDGGAGGNSEFRIPNSEFI
jgi:hypothetical protein